MNRQILLSSVLSFALPAAAGLIPAGPEFPVNTYILFGQRYPSVASDSSGSFVVVWESLREGGYSSYGVFGQRYDSTGTPLGTEFHVNTYTTNYQLRPSVASDSGGNFVVVWQSGGQDGDGYGIFGQRFAGSGAPIGSEFQVSAYTMSDQAAPSVAVGGNGSFTVVWQSNTQDGSGNGIFGRQFGSSGAPIGPEFRVNSATTSDQDSPSVAADASGGFVVVWTSQHVTPGSVFAQRFSSSGMALGGEFQVNEFAGLYSIYQPSVASRSDGAFLVVWANPKRYASPPRGAVVGQQFMSNGTPAGGNLDIGSSVDQPAPRPAYLAGGDPVIVWAQFGDDVVWSQVGSPSSRVNTYTPNNQNRPAVAALVTGQFVVVWQSFNQDADGIFGGYGIYGQRYCPALTDVSIVLVSGSATLCATSTGGTVGVTDTGGVSATHQWGYRPAPSGPTTNIGGATGSAYVLSGPDFGPGGFYYLVCQTTPSCGAATYSNELLVVTADTAAPTVAVPAPLTTRQSLCQ